jgi:cytochrome b subunit of formate dehydrogenase
MAKDKDRSSPVPTEHRKSEQGRNQSTETRTMDSGSKTWIVVLVVVIFLLIILAVTGVINF